MQSIDPKYLEQLRNLPTPYLFDMLADGEEFDRDSVCQVLQERGLNFDEIDRGIARRRNSRLPRPQKIWSLARWFTLACTLVTTFFNANAFQQLLRSEHVFKSPLIFFAVGCVLFGFLIGFKLTCHIYLGGKKHLYCGFPVAVGYVDVESGFEIIPDKLRMISRMALNALVGVNLTLFPLMFIFVMMSRRS